MAINHQLREASAHALPDGRFGYIAPSYKEAKRIAWDYWHRFAEPIPGVAFNEVELRVDLPTGAKVFLLGAEDPDSLRGPYWDGMVFDEYAHVHPRAWPEIVRPALTSRQGWALFLGTPFGRNQFYTLYERARQSPEFLTRCYRASETGVLPTEELTLARAEMTPEQYAQEFECSFDSAIIGAYYARELEVARAAQHIRAVPWEPAIPVETWWDLGFSDATAVIFGQRMGRELHVIDYLEGHHAGLEWYAREVLRKPYLYGKHWFPHDAGHGVQHSAGQTLAQQASLLGLKPQEILGPTDVLDGINQARLMFPRVWFDQEKCQRLLDALAAYRADWDESKQASRPTPRHDWASHGADAFRYLAVSLRDIRGPMRTTPRQPATVAFSPFTYDRPKSRAKTAFELWPR
jgi:phage terminase large subunit